MVFTSAKFSNLAAISNSKSLSPIISLKIDFDEGDKG
jgi:hypothetical protein